MCYGEPVRTVLAMLVLLASACGGAPPPRAEAAPPAAPALVASEPRLAEGVTLLAPVCAEGTAEACDAIDQDCDGAIDEGCEGAADAPLVAAVAWNGSAAVELVLHGPGAPITVTGACDGPRLARAAAPALEAGTYALELAHVDACGDEEPITITSMVSVDGAALGPFNRALAPGERARVVELDLSPELELSAR